MKNILITSVGQRVSLVRAFQKELRLIYSNAKVYSVDADPLLATACHVSDGSRSIVKVKDDNYISELLTICKEWNIGMIVPTIDTELLVLALNREFFLKEGIVVVVSSYDFVKKCRDKRLTNQFFTQKRICIPRPVNKDNPTFPLFIKPYDGSLSKDTFIIKKQEDLLSYHYENEKLMFMEYVNAEEYEEYTVDAYYNKNNELCCAVPRKRISVRNGEISKGATKRNEIVDLFIEKLSYIDGARGCLTIQVFFNKKNKNIIGIEINPRFGGGYPLSYQAGANYPKWLMEEYYENKEIVYTDNWEENLLMLRYDDEILVKNYVE